MHTCVLTHKQPAYVYTYKPAYIYFFSSGICFSCSPLWSVGAEQRFPVGVCEWLCTALLSLTVRSISRYYGEHLVCRQRGTGKAKPGVSVTPSTFICCVGSS